MSRNPTDLLFRADDASLQRIQSISNADWNMDAVFERSYQKYQAGCGKAPMPQPKLKHRYIDTIVVTAACLLLTIGTGGTLVYLRNARPAHQVNWKTETATTRQTSEAATETKTTTTAPPETVTLPALLPHSTAPQTTAAVHTSASRLETASLLPSETLYEPTEPPAAQTVPTIAQPETHSDADTDAPELPSGTQIMESIAASSSTEMADTAPPDTTPLTTELAVTTQTDTAPPTETALTEPPTTGFISEDEAPYQKLTFVSDHDSAPVDAVYMLDMEGFAITETVTDEKSAKYLVQGESSRYSIEHFRYEDFYFRYAVGNTTIQEVQVQGRAGYLARHSGYPGIYILIWDDGGGISLINAFTDDNTEMRQIAEHFTMEG